MSGQGASYGTGMSEHDYYAILGVTRDAPAEEIKARYKDLVLKFHPDREGSALAAEVMVSINLAYEVLSDPQRRQSYDRDQMAAPSKARQEESRAQQEQAPKQSWRQPERGTTPGPKYDNIVNRMERRAHLLMLGSIAAAFVAGLLLMPAAEDGTVAGQYIGSSRDIFNDVFNEALVSLPLLVPGLGVAWGFLAVFDMGLTGRAVFEAAPGIHGSVAGDLLPYALLATGLKMFACYLGMRRSALLVRSIWMRKIHMMDGICTEVDILAVLLLHGLAALVEFMMAVNA